jgi:hypothetical protein
MSTKKEKSSMAQPLRMRRDYDSSQLKVIPVEPEQKINISELDYDGKIIPKPVVEEEQIPMPTPPPPPPPVPETDTEVIEEDAPMSAPAPLPGMLGCPMCGQRARIRGDIEKLPPKMTCPHCGVSYPKGMVKPMGDGTFKLAAISPEMEKKWQEHLKKVNKGESPSEGPQQKPERPIINFMTRREFSPKLKLLTNVTKDYTKKKPESAKIIDMIEELRFKPTFKNEEEAEKVRKDILNQAQKVGISYATFLGKAIDTETTYSELKKIADEINPEGSARRRTAAVYEKAAALLDLVKAFALELKG